MGRGLVLEVEGAGVRGGVRLVRLGVRGLVLELIAVLAIRSLGLLKLVGLSIGSLVKLVRLV